MHLNHGHVVSSFVVQAWKNGLNALYGDGTQSRSFCYVDDLIEGFVRLMGSHEGFTGPNKLRNSGEFTMTELPEAMCGLTGSHSELVHRPLPADEPRQSQPDIWIAREYLCWEPKIPLRKGLKPTIGVFEGLRKDGQGTQKVVE